MSEDEDLIAEYVRSGAITRWDLVQAIRARAAELAREAAERRRAEEQDRRQWIEGVRRRLGLVPEVHDTITWEVGAAYWGWACTRPGCRLGGGAPVLGPDHFGASQAAVRRMAREHAARFMPPAPGRSAGAGLDLTGFPAVSA